jgi:hypothetical protein
MYPFCLVMFYYLCGISDNARAIVLDIGNCVHTELVL